MLQQTQTPAQVRQAIYKELIPACANGNKDAADYLRRICFIVRTVDDVYDGDKPVSRQDIVDSFFLFAGEIAGNKFFRQHIDQLTALHVVAFNAWQDANEWEQSDDSLKQMYAHVLRDYICDVFAYTAYLTGGRHHMRGLSLRIRAVFLKELGM